MRLTDYKYSIVCEYYGGGFTAMHFDDTKLFSWCLEQKNLAVITVWYHHTMMIHRYYHFDKIKIRDTMEHEKRTYEKFHTPMGRWDDHL